MEKELQVFKEVVLLQVAAVELEYNVLVDKVKAIKYKQKNPDAVNFIWDYEMENLYEVRKDVKYALMIIELYAIVEQAMVALYKCIKNEDFLQGSSNMNKIVLIEEALKHDIETKYYMYPLAILRNKVIHESLNLKRGKQLAIEQLHQVAKPYNQVLPKEICQYYINLYTKGQKKLVKEIIEEVRDYIGSIQLVKTKAANY